MNHFPSLPSLRTLLGRTLILPLTLALTPMLANAQPQSEGAMTDRFLDELIDKIATDANASRTVLDMGDLSVPHLMRAARTAESIATVEKAIWMLGYLRARNLEGPSSRFWHELAQESDAFTIARALDALTSPIEDSLHPMIRGFSQSSVPMIQSAVLRPMGIIGEIDYILEKCESVSSFDALNAFDWIKAHAKERISEALGRVKANPAIDLFDIEGVTELILSSSPNFITSLLTQPELSKRVRAWEEVAKGLDLRKGRLYPHHLLLTEYISLPPSQWEKVCERFVEALPQSSYLLTQGIKAAYDLPWTDLQFHAIIDALNPQANVGAIDHILPIIDQMVKEKKDDPRWIQEHVSPLFDTLKDRDLWLQKSFSEDHLLVVLDQYLTPKRSQTPLGRNFVQTLANMRSAESLRILHRLAAEADGSLPLWFDVTDSGHSEVLIQALMAPGANQDQRLLDLVRALDRSRELREALPALTSLDSQSALFEDIWEAIANKEDPNFRRGVIKTSLTSPIPSRIAWQLIRGLEIPPGAPEKSVILASLFQKDQGPLEMAARALDRDAAGNLIYGRLVEMAEEDASFANPVRDFMIQNVNRYWNWNLYARIPGHDDSSLRRGMMAALQSHRSGFGSELAWIRSQGDPNWIPVVSQILATKDSASAVDAMRTLVSFRSLESAPQITPFLTHPDSATRAAAEDSLKTLERYQREMERWSNPEERNLARDPMEWLIEQTRDKNHQVRNLAIESLGTLGQPEALPFLIELLRSDNEDVISAAKKAIDKLQRQ